MPNKPQHDKIKIEPLAYIQAEKKGRDKNSKLLKRLLIEYLNIFNSVIKIKQEAKVFSRI